MKAINIAWPIQKGNSGFFRQTFDSIDAIKSKINILFNTMENERPFNPDFGLGSLRYVFEPLTDELYTTIQNKIADKINRYIPEINIVSIELDTTDVILDSNRLIIKLYFSQKTNPSVIDNITV